MEDASYTQVVGWRRRALHLREALREAERHVGEHVEARRTNTASCDCGGHCFGDQGEYWKKKLGPGS